MGLELKTENTRDWVYMHEMKDGEIGIVIEDNYKDRIIQCYSQSIKQENYTSIISLGFHSGKSWTFKKGTECNNKVKILPKGTELIIN